MSFIAVYITHNSADAAKALTDVLIEERYIACANIFPMQSAYWWKGAIAREDEVVSIVKTIPENWSALVGKVKQLHPYEVPCIMKIEAEANVAYEAWIRENVEPKRNEEF